MAIIKSENRVYLTDYIVLKTNAIFINKNKTKEAQCEIDGINS